jgi:peptidoglycan/LPS O-acetylase OafA/YrhL
MARSEAGPQRRTELDAIRLLVVLGLVFFHAALVFDSRDDYYVKNAETTDVTTILAGLCVVWAMPILFLISGFGAWHSLHRRAPGTFTMERLRRLGVPLVFATVVMMPLPQWLRLRAADSDDDESYWHFWPRFFDVHLELSDFPFILEGEHFETGHLWFVVLLLTFSLVLAALVRLVPGERVRPWGDWFGSVLARRGGSLLPAVPIALISAFVGLEESFAGWSRWAYLLFFLGGFVLAVDDRFRSAMRRDAVLAAVIGFAAFQLTAPGFLTADDPFTDMTALSIGTRAAFGVAGWCCVVGILGLLDRRRWRAESASRREGEKQPEGEAWPAGTSQLTNGSARRRLYGYLAVAALPVYILHQPIVVAVAYVVVDWEASIPVKYAVIVAISLALTLAVYDVAVRRTRVTRFLFGMREPVRPARLSRRTG